MNWFKRSFLSFVEWLIKSTNEWKLPWVKKILTGEQINEILLQSQPGDILLVRAGGYFSTLYYKIFKLGTYTHCAFVPSKGAISDSTGEGVSTRLMLSTLIGYTKAAIIRPPFTEEEWSRAWHMHNLIMESDAKKDIEYNFRLVEIIEDGRGDKIPDRVTCAQFISLIVNAARPNYMEPRERFGFLTISPEDYALAKSKFDLIKEFN